MPNRYTSPAVAVVDQILPCPADYPHSSVVVCEQPTTRCLVCYVETGVFLRLVNGCGCKYDIHFACFCTYASKQPQHDATQITFTCPFYCQRQQTIRSRNDVRLEFVALPKHMLRTS